METNYGVGVSNRYNLFLDEDADPLEILKIQEEEKAKAAKKEKIAVKDAKGKPGSKAGPKKEEASKKVVRPVAALSESNRGDLGKPRSDIVKRDENRNEGAPRYDNRGGDEGGRGGRGGFRGRGGGFGGGRGGGRGRGGGTYEARGKREYERHSGTDKTGIKAVEKREGGGAHNWGRATDNYENAGWTPSEETVNGTAEQPEASKEGVEDKKEPLAEGEEGKEETTAVDENEAEKAEPEETLLTLEEWKALQEEKRNKPTFNIRRAGEGEDPKQWKNTFVLKKKEPLSDEESEEEEEEEEEEEVGRQQSMAEQIQFVFFSGPARRGGRGRGRGGRGGGPPTERGERGERGGGRGGFERRGGGERGGRGGGRFGDRPGGPGRERVQHAPRVDDENDFPAL